MEAYCVAVATAASVDGALAAFAADPGSLRSAAFSAQWDMAAPYPDGGGNDTVAVDALAGAVVCAQANGWAGTREECAAELSRGGVYVCSYRNVNAVMEVVYARDGELLRRFDPLLYEPWAGGALPEEAGLPFGTDQDSPAAAFCLMQRLTGVEITRDWLLKCGHPTYLRDTSG